MSKLEARYNGLAVVAAAQKLRDSGPNELASSKPRTLLAIAFDRIREPMFLLLLAVCFIWP